MLGQTKALFFQIRFILISIASILNLLSCFQQSNKKSFTSGNITFSYTEEGEGQTPLIIITGYKQLADNWKPIEKNLTLKFKVIIIELPNLNNLELIADTVVSFINQKSLKNIYLLGHSRGGKVAALIASQNPKLINKLIIYGVSRTDGKFSIINKTNLGYTPIFKKILCPTLLVYGENDLLASPKYGKSLTTLIQNSKLSIIPQASHLAHLDEPNEFTNLLKNFLSVSLY